MRKLPRDVRFFATGEGSEPVREWLKELPKEERRIIDENIKTIQGTLQWRKPLVDFLGDGIWEARSTLPNTIARVLFAEIGGEMILLHGFKKKTRKTPPGDLKLAVKRKKHMKARNKHRGSSLDSFLKEEGIYEEVCAAAAKRLLSEQLREALDERHVKISALAKRMHTSRAVVQRLLDQDNTSVTLQTLEKAARAIGKRWKFELVEA